MQSLNERLLNEAKEGKVAEITSLLDQGADVNFVPFSAFDERLTPLFEAVTSGHEAAALLLLDRGARVDVRDRWGMTALHLACSRGLESVARGLIKRGADVEAKNNARWRPLHYAALWGRDNVVRLLVEEHGVQLNAPNQQGADPRIMPTHRDTSRQWACRRGWASLVTRLLDEFGMDIHERDEKDHSFLHIAAANGHLDLINILLDRGLPIDEVDISGRSALNWACSFGRTAAAELLLDRGADIDLEVHDGWNALVWAMECHDKPTMLLLLERGARLDGPLPESFRFSSYDRGLAAGLQKGFLKKFFTEPDIPISLHRQALRWALSSPAVAALAAKRGWSLVGAAKTKEEAEEMRKKRLEAMHADAWERRKHLVIDKALDWGY